MLSDRKPRKALMYRRREHNVAIGKNLTGHRRVAILSPGRGLNRAALTSREP